jgi:glycosyltransferase involved in cell wall biosynthesis
MPTVLLPHPPNGNLYIRELGRAYAAAGWTPIYGAENLLEGNLLAGALRPDLLHLHWPEEFYRWRGEGALPDRAQHFLDRLKAMRAAGVPMVWTVHNVAPHDVRDAGLDDRVYRSVIEMADLIHHHCPCSVTTLAQRYGVSPDKPAFVQAHGHYFSYPNTISREDARRELGIPPQARVFLQFGQIRGYKGLNLLLNAFDQLKLDRKHLVVAGQYTPPSGRGAALERLQLAWRKRTASNFLLVGRSIDSARIQLYVNAADCMVLSHTAGLNSGVAVLAMSFGKPVIGPDLGCLSWVLGQGPNPIYKAGDAKALANAMRQMFDDEARLVQIGQANRDAASGWGWNHIAAGALQRLELHA